jgi:hypothetical protein
MLLYQSELRVHYRVNRPDGIRTRDPHVLSEVSLIYGTCERLLSLIK